MNRPLTNLGLFLVVALAIAPPTPLNAQHTVTLLNGDRLSGTLQRIDGTMWVFAYGGEDVSLPVAQVAGLASSTPIGVRLDDGTINAVTIAPTPGGLLLTWTTGTRTVTPTQIAAIGSATDLEALVPLQIGLFSPIARFWVANIAFGFSDKSGNSRARGLATTLDIERRTTKDRVTFGFGLIRESSQSPSGSFETTVSKSYGTLRMDVFVNSRIFVFGATRQERDRFQDIALRSTYNVGLGFQAFANRETDLNFSFAGGVRREDFISAGAESATVASVASKVRHDFGPAVLLWRLDFSPKLQDPKDFRFVSDVTITAPLFFGVGFRLGALNEHTSRPRPGIEKNDLLITTRLTYSIGQ